MVTAAETLGRAAALTGDEAVRGARLLDAAELALDIGRDDLVERLLADAGPLALAPETSRAARGCSGSRAGARPSRPGSRPTSTASTGSPTTCARLAGAADGRVPRLVVGRPAPAARRMVARARTLRPAPRSRWWRSRSRRPRTRARGRGLDGALDPDELPSELLRVAAAVTGVVGEFDLGVAIGDRTFERLRARGRYGCSPRRWSAAPGTASSPAPGARRWPPRRTRPSSRGSPTAAVGGRGPGRTGALTGLRGDVARGLALADEAERTLPPGAADGMLAMIEAARGLAPRRRRRPGSVRAPAAGARPGRALVHRLRRALGSPTRPRPPCWPRARRRARARGPPRRSAPVAHLTASVAFARLLLAPTEADARAEEALTAGASCPCCAPVQLAHGGHLRRRRAAEARALLRAARDTFEGSTSRRRRARPQRVARRGRGRAHRRGRSGGVPPRRSCRSPGWPPRD